MPRFAREDRRQASLERREHRRVHDCSVLDHFGQPLAEFALRQALERGDVGHDQPRLIKGADQILGAPMVQAGLAAERRVNLPDHGSRHLHDGEAAHICGRGEASQVADHAPAQRENRTLAREPGLDHRVEHALVSRQRLARLAGGNLDHRGVKPGLHHRIARALAVERGDVTVGDDRGASRCNPGLARQVAEPVQQSGADMHRMGVRAEFYAAKLYAEGSHRCAARAPTAFITRSAACSGERSDVSIVTCAFA